MDGAEYPNKRKVHAVVIDDEKNVNGFVPVTYQGRHIAWVKPEELKPRKVLDDSYLRLV